MTINYCGIVLYHRMIVLQIHGIKHNNNLQWYVISSKRSHFGNVHNIASRCNLSIIFGVKVVTSVQPVLANEKM
jgi:hypothetical protein